MTSLEPAEMRFLRSVTGYTRLDKIRSEVIRKKLEIPWIQDVRLKYKQNWINHLERMDITRTRNTPSTTNLQEEETVDVPGDYDNASMPEQVKRPNPWRRKKKKKKKKKKKMMMMMMMMTCTGLCIWTQNSSIDSQTSQFRLIKSCDVEQKDNGRSAVHDWKEAVMVHLTLMTELNSTGRFSFFSRTR